DMELLRMIQNDGSVTQRTNRASGKMAQRPDNRGLAGRQSTEIHGPPPMRLNDRQVRPTGGAAAGGQTRRPAVESLASASPRAHSLGRSETRPARQVGRRVVERWRRS